MVNGNVGPMSNQPALPAHVQPMRQPPQQPPQPSPAPLAPPMGAGMMDPAVMEAAVRQMGPAGTFMMGALGMMANMSMSMAQMMGAMQLQQRQMEMQQQAQQAKMLGSGMGEAGREPQWDHTTPHSQLAPNSPPPYRMNGGEHW